MKRSIAALLYLVLLLTVSPFVAQTLVCVVIGLALLAALRQVGKRLWSPVWQHLPMSILSSASGIFVLLVLLDYSAIEQAKRLAVRIDAECKSSKTCALDYGDLTKDCWTWRCDSHLGWLPLFRANLEGGDLPENFSLTVERSLLRQTANFTGGANTRLIGHVL